MFMTIKDVEVNHNKINKKIKGNNEYIYYGKRNNIWK